MSIQQDEIVLTVQRLEDDDTVTDIGKLSFGDHGKLTVISAEAAFKSVLETIVSTVNAQEELRIKVPPPPDAEPGSLYRRSATRDDADLLDVMREYLDQKYGLILNTEQ